MFTTCQALLDGVVEALPDPPARCYVTDGLPVWDCEQLTVHATTILRGTTGRTDPTARRGPITVVVAVTRLWAVPKADKAPPTLAKQRQSGERVTRGGFDLWQAVSKVAQELNCNAAVDQAASVGPDGGYTGWQVTVRLTPPSE